MVVAGARLSASVEDHEQVGAQYGIPYEYGWFAFGTKWIDAMHGFMED